MKKFLFFALLSCFAALFAGDEVYTLEYSGNRNTLFCNGKVVTFADCVEKQLARYPEYTAFDIARFALDGAFGGGSHKFDKILEEKNIRQDFAAAKEEKRPLFEIISPDYCRINLSAWKFHKLPVEWLFSIYCSSSEVFADSSAIYSDYLRIVAPMIADRLKKAPVEPVEENRPTSYRVVSTRFLQVIPVLQKLVTFPENSVVVIALDGRAASGKTTLARQLASITGAGVIHMDDFFLPLEMRNSKRLSQPGGNVHYERFKVEVLHKLKSANAFSYQRFECSKMKLGAMRSVAASRWRVVEGAYSFHPGLGNYADLKIFYDIDPVEQLKRIGKRNGVEAAKTFANRWIPFEEKYIKSFKVKEQADIVLGGRSVR